MFRKKVNNESIDIYVELKDKLLELLSDTERYCKDLCERKYSQERHLMVANGLLSGVESNRKIIAKSVEQVEKEIDFIEENHADSFARARALVKYGQGLTDLRFSLFMEVFTGKLRKRWLPLINEKYPALLSSEQHLKLGL